MVRSINLLTLVVAYTVLILAVMVASVPQIQELLFRIP